MSTHTRWTTTLAAGAVLAAAALAVAAPPAGSGAASLDRFKSLAGEWVAAEDNEMVKKGELVSRYVVSAGGTAVVETVFPGSPHEMVTVYHLDGSELVLTHYCMEGNQPRMRARKTDGARIDFAFEGGTNIDPARSRHMNSAWVEFVGADEIRNQWTEIADGKPVFVAKSHLVRKAR
jgi:hypothetical protein